MKVAVITPRYSISGVPLAQIRFAKAWAAAGHDVDVIFGAETPGAQLPEVPGVRVHVLGRRRVLGMLWPIQHYLRREKPDLVFTAEDHLTAVTLMAAAFARSQARISGSSRVSPFDTYQGSLGSKGWALKSLMRYLMPRAAALTCVSKDMVRQYQDVFPGAPHTWAYNIVDDNDARRRMEEPVDEPWLLDKQVPVLVAAGGLYPWKGFADLLDAMALVVEQRPARLLLLGDGPLRSNLQAQVETLGLQANVKLVGVVSNPLKYFRRADVFALSSYVEGMPNVLVEAMVCGCTPVATNCPTGPRELLDNGRIGSLVPMRDPKALAAGILRALAHPADPKDLAEAVAPFTEQAVLNRHATLLGLPLAQTG